MAAVVMKVGFGIPGLLASNRPHVRKGFKV